MQSPNVIDAKALENYIISITFENGEERVFDVKPYLNYPVFRPLNDEKEFRSFSVVDGTIEWICGADFSQDTFYLESKSTKKSAVM